jgi:hypothetical protein
MRESPHGIEQGRSDQYSSQKFGCQDLPNALVGYPKTEILDPLGACHL